MKTSEKMPVLFIGHGSPMNAIEDNEFSRSWATLAKTLPTPQAVLCVSAHWETRGTAVTAMETPRTIHDFYGFPRELNEYDYPAPGSPELASSVRQHVKSADVSADSQWGLDHGAWSVLCHMFPQANIPVVQLSIDHGQPMDSYYALGKELVPLREEGILILGSGNLVHNLAIVDNNTSGYDWALEYDQKVRDWIKAGEHDQVVQYEHHGKVAMLAVNSREHYIPLLYVLGASAPGEPVTFYNEVVTMGSISMRCVKIG